MIGTYYRTRLAEGYHTGLINSGPCSLDLFTLVDTGHASSFLASNAWMSLPFQINPRHPRQLARR